MLVSNMGGCLAMSKGKINPRQSNSRARVRAAQRYAAMNAPCALCGGLRGDIHYDEPRSHLFPLSLVIDEIAPVSRWQEFGYSSARECASDPNNWQPAHYVCNAEASDKRERTKKKSGTNGNAVRAWNVRPDAVSGTF